MKGEGSKPPGKKSPKTKAKPAKEGAKPNQRPKASKKVKPVVDE